MYARVIWSWESTRDNDERCKLHEDIVWEPRAIGGKRMTRGEHREESSRQKFWQRGSSADSPWLRIIKRELIPTSCFFLGTLIFGFSSEKKFTGYQVNRIIRKEILSQGVLNGDQRPGMIQAEIFTEIVHEMRCMSLFQATVDYRALRRHPNEKFQILKGRFNFYNPKQGNWITIFVYSKAVLAFSRLHTILVCPGCWAGPTCPTTQSAGSCKLRRNRKIHRYRKTWILRR